MTRVALLVFGLVAAFIAIVVVVGWLLPVRHRASRTATIRARPTQVFSLIADVEAFPAWRSGLKSVDVVSRDSTGRPLRYRERGSNGDILFEFVARDENRRLVSRIADPKLPFGGTWTYELRAAGGETELMITEDGEIYNFIYRFVSRYLMGYTRTIDTYLADVERKLR